MSQDVPDPLPVRTPDTRPERLDDTRPDRLEEPRPDRLPDTRPDRLPDTPADRLPDTRSDRVEEPRLDRLPDAPADRLPQPLPARRLLLVHAHPDDESINTGATMAKYSSEGAHVTLVTCTLGEEGEVLVESLAHLAAGRDDKLGPHRIDELAEAMKALGVTDHRFLGGAGHFRDTGMATDDSGLAVPPSQVRADSFWAADLTAAADLLVDVIREVRPQVLVTYDEQGGYGHPDHIQAHRVAMYASMLAAAPSYRQNLGAAWDVDKIYWTATSAERLRAGLRHLRAQGDLTTFEGMDPEGPLPSFAVPDELITTEVDGAAHVDAKLAAMQAHATQIALDGPFFALSNNLGNEVWAVEGFRLVKGRLGPGAADGGREADLFDGVA